MTRMILLNSNCLKFENELKKCKNNWHLEENLNEDCEYLIIAYLP